MILKDKVAIVTGASKGIGKSIALTLARQGMHLAISARNKGLLEETGSEIRNSGARCSAFAGDMSREEDIRSFIQSVISEFGRLDVLVNNAGMGHFRPVCDLTTAEWDEMFNLNVRGLFLLTRECLPHLRKSGESVIVNVASLAGKNAFVNGAGYAATKHAVLGFSRCLMLEERNNGVRVLAICPGSVDTSFSTNPKKPADAGREKILRPEDVADSILHMLQLPQRAMVSEIDIRPTNP
jgi:3-oxoacyl-[acyl-carrier protein] reductase